MIHPVRIGAVLLTVVSLVACGSSGEGGSPGGSASGKPTAGATGAAPAATGAKVPELVDMKNDKRKFTFKAPKDTKADAGGDSYQWDTMQIMVEVTPAPVAKGEDLMQVVMASLKDGAKIDYKTEGEVQIAMWQLPKSPMNMVCGQTGKSVALRIALEPDHKDIALAMCKSLRIEK